MRSQNLFKVYRDVVNRFDHKCVEEIEGMKPDVVRNQLKI